ncbi:hypothetical protein ABBQ32_013450 [Trebouxia sp. C0010 RCD-2024]
MTRCLLASSLFTSARTVPHNPRLPCRSYLSVLSAGSALLRTHSANSFEQRLSHAHLPVSSVQASEGPHCVIRPACRSDIRIFQTILNFTNASWPEEMLEATLHQEYTVALIASSSSLDVGCLIAWLISDELQILDIVVCPEHRRQGYGQQLLQTLLQVARSRGCSTATLEVSRNNIAAIQLYEHVGFRRVHVRKAYYKDGSDALLLNLALDGWGGVT